MKHFLALVFKLTHTPVTRSIKNITYLFIQNTTREKIHAAFERHRWVHFLKKPAQHTPSFEPPRAPREAAHMQSNPLKPGYEHRERP